MTSVVLSAPHVESTANIPLSRVTTAYPAAAVSLTEFHCDVPQNQLAYLAPNRFSTLPPQCHLPVQHCGWTQELLIAELERLLSRESIVSQADAYITSLFMTSASLELSVAALASHPRLAPVSHQQLLDAAAASKVLSVNTEKQMIIPELKGKRSTLILRDVDPCVTAQDIVSVLKESPDLQFSDLPTIFDEQHLNTISQMCPQILSLCLVGNGCWFLTLDNEERTQNLAWWLRNQTLKGVRIQVRMKSESPLRLTFPFPSCIPRSMPCPPEKAATSELKSPNVASGHNNKTESHNRVKPSSQEHRHGRFRRSSRLQTPSQCSFCRKQGKKYSSPKEQNPTLSSDGSKEARKSTAGETRCLCHLLPARALPTNNIKQNTSHRRQPPASTERHQKEKHETSESWRERERPSGPSSQRQKAKPRNNPPSAARRRPDAASLKTRIIPVVESKKPNKKYVPRFKVPTSSKPVSAIAEFPPLYEDAVCETKDWTPAFEAAEKKATANVKVTASEATESNLLQQSSKTPTETATLPVETPSVVRDAATIQTSSSEMPCVNVETQNEASILPAAVCATEDLAESKKWNAQAFWAQRTQRQRTTDHQAVPKELKKVDKSLNTPDTPPFSSRNASTSNNSSALASGKPADQKIDTGNKADQAVPPPQSIEKNKAVNTNVSIKDLKGGH